MRSLARHCRCWLRPGAILLTLGLWSVAAVGQAQLRTFVDPKVLDETETVRLTLRLEGARSAAAPDLAALERDFEILGNSSSSQYRSVNGQVQAWVEYQITLKPLQPGVLTIPAVTLGGYQSEATRIEVNPLDPALRQAIEEMVFFELELNPEPVYVQAELKLVRRLYYATNGGVQMYSDLPGAPEIADAVVIALADARSYATSRNGIDYGVVEQTFAIYPESSGTLTIPAVSLTSSVRMLKQGRMRRSGVRVSSAERSVTVLPIPPEYPSDAPWLPASSVQLNQHINPDQNIQTGSTVTHQLQVIVQGNVSSVIAPLPVVQDPAYFREYPDAPLMADELIGGTNIGVRAQTTSLQPLKPGRAMLPAVSLTWWNTEFERVEVASAPAIRVDIGGAPIDTGRLETPADEPANAAAQADAPSSERSEPLVRSRAIPWRYLLPAMLLAGLIALTLWFRPRWQARLQSLPQAVAGAWQRWRRQRERPAALVARVERSLTRRIDALPAATLANQRALLLKTLLADALTRVLGGDHSSALSRLRMTEQGRALLDQLDAAGYGRDRQNLATLPDRTALLRVFRGTCERLLADTGTPAAPSLPPLYPEPLRLERT